MDWSIYCPYCHRHTKISQEAEYFKNKHGYWYIGKCNNCLMCVLVQANVYDNIKSIKPDPLPKPLDERTPEFLKNDMEETVKCQSIGAYKATCGLARMIIQKICKEKGANPGKKLQDQIDELNVKGVITNDMKGWAHEVRYVGNEVLHADSSATPPTEEDAKDMVLFVEKMIEILYIAPAIAAERKAKRGKP